jgi:hypothetical protein
VTRRRSEKGPFRRDRHNMATQSYDDQLYTIAEEMYYTVPELDGKEFVAELMRRSREAGLDVTPEEARASLRRTVTNTETEMTEKKIYKRCRELLGHAEEEVAYRERMDAQYDQVVEGEKTWTSMNLEDARLYIDSLRRSMGCYTLVLALAKKYDLSYDRDILVKKLMATTQEQVTELTEQLAAKARDDRLYLRRRRQQINYVRTIIQAPRRRLCAGCGKREPRFDDLCGRCAEKAGTRPTGKI